MNKKVDVSNSVRSDITFQSYGPGPEIVGVFHVPLKKHRSLEGWFMEYMRLTDGTAEVGQRPFNIWQVSFSKAIPRRMNAFHIHPKEIQDELWTAVDGTLMVWLVDCRAGSSTEGNKRRYVLDGEEPAVLHIPSGVAHGYKAGPNGALLVYAMNNQFNPKDPNEGRLPWDYFGEELWREDRG